ncbi:MAG: hypothetical protein ACKOPU_01685 [Candidatus Planktophila sp.]
MSDLRKLDTALDGLVHDGSLSVDQAEMIRSRYIATEVQSESRKSVLAEIAGYLGGAFVVIAITIITARQWESFLQWQRATLFGALAVTLFALALIVGKSTSVKARLAGVLYGLSAASTTGTVAIIDPQNEAPTLAFLAGTAVAIIGYYFVQTLVGHVVMYGFIFLAGIMVASDLTPVGAGPQIFIGSYFIVLGTGWLALTYFEHVDQNLGFLFAGATLFIATQVFFFRTDHLPSYLAMIYVASLTTWLYLRVNRWPLLITAVLTTTVGVGEFVAQTLGGSVGSALGLFAAGAALVTSSLLALRNKREKAPDLT